MTSYGLPFTVVEFEVIVFGADPVTAQFRGNMDLLTYYIREHNFPIDLAVQINETAFPILPRPRNIPVSDVFVQTPLQCWHRLCFATV